VVSFCILCIQWYTENSRYYETIFPHLLANINIWQSTAKDFKDN